MLFLVSHANETEDQSYTIKHIYLHASSLLHAHVYVTLFGYKISPEFYDSLEDENDFVDPTENDINHYLNYTIEYFEQINKECSYGEHYWHSIKQIQNLNNQYPLIIGDQEKAKSLFKLIIQTNNPCSKHSEDNITHYDIEQNTDIYQFQAENLQDIIQYIFTHVQDYKGLKEFSEQMNHTYEQLANMDWQTMSTLCQENLQECNQSSEDCQKRPRIKISCEKISQPISVFHSEI